MVLLLLVSVTQRSQTRTVRIHRTCRPSVKPKRTLETEN